MTLKDIIESLNYKDKAITITKEIDNNKEMTKLFGVNCFEYLGKDESDNPIVNYIVHGRRISSNDVEIKDLGNETSLDFADEQFFDDGTNNYVKELKAKIEPIQIGTGTPSPNNIRPIIGYNSCDVTVDSISKSSLLTNNEPYVIRQSGGNTDIGESNYEVDEIVGATVKWNQLVQNGNFEDLSVWKNRCSTTTLSDNVITLTKADVEGTNYGALYWQKFNLTTTHRYYLSCEAKTNNKSYNATIHFAASGFSVGGNTAKYTNSLNFTRIEFVTSPVNKSDILTLRLGNSSTPIGQSGNFKNVICVDLTEMFGTEIAEYAYSLDSAKLGKGAIWLHANGFLSKPYYNHVTGKLESVNVSAHKMTFNDNSTEYTYSLDSSLQLRGLFKLDANNNLYADGDTYSYNGIVTRNYAIRSYQSGDSSLANSITDGTNTVYKLNSSTYETAEPFTYAQQVNKNGTEEYIDYSEFQGTRDVSIPVGHNTKYILKIYTTLFNDKIYCGELNMTTGKLTITHSCIDSYNGEELPGKWISSEDVYVEGTTPTTGSQVVYELESPIVQQLSATKIKTLVGDNDIWANTGEIALKYVAQS